jgi:prepilin-type N-terminal cleavage/methylation domain-containing protein
MNKEKTYNVTLRTSGKQRTNGFTLIEMLISMIVMLISISAIGTIIVDNQRGWSRLYDSAYSDIMTDGYVAKKKFDSVVRKASSANILIANYGHSVEVYQYSSSSSAVTDLFACFYLASGELKLAYGQLNPRVLLSVETVCKNVSQCHFSKTGSSIQMELKLDNGTQENTVLSSAVAQNL